VYQNKKQSTRSAFLFWQAELESLRDTHCNVLLAKQAKLAQLRRLRLSWVAGKSRYFFVGTSTSEPLATPQLALRTSGKSFPFLLAKRGRSAREGNFMNSCALCTSSVAGERLFPFLVPDLLHS
jgi:hypothetical protein